MMVLVSVCLCMKGSVLVESCLGGRVGIQGAVRREWRE